MAVPSAVHGTPATAGTGMNDEATSMPFSNGARQHPAMPLSQGTCTPASPAPCPPSHVAPHDTPPPRPVCHPAPCQPHCPVFPSPHGLTAPWPQAPASTSSWTPPLCVSSPHSSRSHSRCPAPSAVSTAGTALPHSHPMGALVPGGSSIPPSQPGTWAQPHCTSHIPGETHQAWASWPLAPPVSETGLLSV